MKKHILTLVIGLFALSMYGQKTITLDSSIVNNVGGLFFETKTIRYSNGESQITTTLLGDTIDVVRNYQNKIINRTSSMSGDIEIVSDYPRQIKELIRQDGPLSQLLGMGPLKSLLNQSNLMDSTYKIKVDGQERNITFLLSAQGALRYRIDTFPSRNAFYLDRVIRLNNFLSSNKELDLFQFRNSRYYSADKSVQVYLVSQGAGARASRDAAPPEPILDIAAFSDILQPKTLYQNGYVWLDNVWRKWDAKNKTWKVYKKGPKTPIPSKL